LKAGEYNIQSPLVGGGKVNYVVSVRNLGMKYHSLNGESMPFRISTFGLGGWVHKHSGTKRLR